MRKFSFIVALLILLSAMPAYAATVSDIVSISLSDNSSVLSPGQSLRLNAYAIMNDGTFSKLDGDELSWESSDTQLICVDSSGIATAIGDGGFSVITARLGEKSGSICLHSSSKYLINHGFEADKYTIAKDREYFARLSENQKHTGNSSLEIYKDCNISFKRFDLYQSPGYKSSVREAWFYDDGRKNGAGPSVYFQDSKNLVAISAGILNTSSGYYTFANSVASRKNYGKGGITLDDGSGYIGTASSGTFETDVLRTEGWHQVTLCVKNYGNYSENIATENGLITLYIDGVKIFEDRYLPFPVHVIGFKTAADCDYFYDDPIMYIDDFDHPPYIESFEFKGGFAVGETLSAKISAADSDGDEISAIEYLWEQSSDKENWNTLSENSSVSLSDANIGNFIRCTVIPKSGTLEGEAFTAVTPFAIEERYDAPLVSDLSISVPQRTGERLEATYNYKGKYESRSELVWQISEDNKSWSDYTGDFASAWINEKYLRAKITPKDSHNLEGEPIFSEVYYVTLGNAEYYVSNEGSDENGGSRAQPFKTIEKAINTSRTDRANGFDGEISIVLKNEKFQINKPINLTSADKNLLITSAFGGRSELTGGTVLQKNRIKRAENPEILNKIKDKTARKKLMEIDLSGIVDEIPEIGSFVHGNSKGNFDSQIRIFVNGTALSYARWPNERENDLKVAESQLDEITNRYSVIYTDASERAKSWSNESISNLYIAGHYWITWADAFSPIENFDADNCAFSVDASLCRSTYAPSAGDEFYFFNLPEEIDMPGECFIDRKNMKAYYYPYDDSEIQNITVPLSKNRMISGDMATDIRIENIDFTHVRSSVFGISNSEGIVFDGCRFMHFSSINSLSGNNNTIKNCYFYDGCQGGVSVSGGNTKTLSGGGNIIENNIFNSMDSLKKNYSPAIRLAGFNHTVKNNEIYNSYHQVITLSGNDHIIEYNDIHDTTRWTGDMGAIYWLSGPACIGNEIRYNYFHDNGSSYFRGWSQCIFWDDCEIGPYIYGNVFARSNSPVKEGEKPGNRYTVKANGGSLAVVENNIFVDCPTPAQFQNNEKYRDSKGKRNQQVCFWLRAYGKSVYNDTKWWETLKESGYFSDTWKEHYKNTIWEEYVNMFSLDFYNENLASLDAVADEEKLVEIARKYAPSDANKFIGNVVFNRYSPSSSLAGGSNGIEENTYVPTSKDAFLDYENDNFALTDEALSETSGFKNVDMSKIGPQNKDIITGAAQPKTSTLEIGGFAAPKSCVFAEYQYACASSVESASKIKWYCGKSPEDDFEFTGSYGKELYISDELEGKYIKYSVEPKNELGISGEIVFSEPIIVSKTYGIVIENIEKGETAYSFTAENKSTREVTLLGISFGEDKIYAERISLSAKESKDISIKSSKDARLFVFKADNLAPLVTG